MNPAQQSGQVFAVGKYQIIDITMPGVLSGYWFKRKGIDPDSHLHRRCSRWGSYVIMKKRPIVGKYLRGETDNKCRRRYGCTSQMSLLLLVSHILELEDKSMVAGTGKSSDISEEEIQSALERSRSKRSTRNKPATYNQISTTNTSSNIAQSLSPSPRRRSNLAGGKPKPKTQLIATNNTVTKLVPVPVANGNSNSGAARVNSGGATLPDIQLTSLTT